MIARGTEMGVASSDASEGPAALAWRMPRARGASRFTLRPADVVRARIARAVLGTPNEILKRIGSIVLQQHQVDGVRRLGEMFTRYHGALLADEVGLGKTYTALAATRGFGRVLIVAPAALRAMWHEACAQCEVVADFVSAESLSRCAALRKRSGSVGWMGHGFRIPPTRRYAQLERQSCRRRR